MHVLFLSCCLAAVIIPPLYQRVKRAVLPASFEELSPLRRMTGLNLHHGHWGLLFVLGAGTWNALAPRTWLSSVLFFWGLGLILDEIIPHLTMPSADRDRELEVYDRSAKPSLWLTAMAATIMLVVALLWGTLPR